MKTILAICIMLIGVSAMLTEAEQTSAEVLEAMYTTGQQWIQVDIQTNDTTSRTASLKATTLYFALWEEHEVTNDATLHQLDQSIMENTNLVFRFTKPEAMQKLPPPFTDEEVQNTRTYLKKWSNDKLLALDPVEPLVTSLPCKTEDYDTRCRILSVVLIEKELRLRIDCFSGALSIGRPRSQKINSEDKDRTTRPSTLTR